MLLKAIARNVCARHQTKEKKTQESPGEKMRNDEDARQCGRTGSSVVVGSRTKAAKAACGVVVLLAKAAKASTAERHCDCCRSRDGKLDGLGRICVCDGRKVICRAPGKGSRAPYASGRGNRERRFARLAIGNRIGYVSWETEREFVALRVAVAKSMGKLRFHQSSTKLGDGSGGWEFFFFSYSLASGKENGSTE